MKDEREAYRVGVKYLSLETTVATLCYRFKKHVIKRIWLNSKLTCGFDLIRCRLKEYLQLTASLGSIIIEPSVRRFKKSVLENILLYTLHVQMTLYLVTVFNSPECIKKSERNKRPMCKNLMIKYCCVKLSSKFKNSRGAIKLERAFWYWYTTFNEEYQ